MGLRLMVMQAQPLAATPFPPARQLPQAAPGVPAQSGVGERESCAGERAGGGVGDLRHEQTHSCKRACEGPDHESSQASQWLAGHQCPLKNARTPECQVTHGGCQAAGGAGGIAHCAVATWCKQLSPRLRRGSKPHREASRQGETERRGDAERLSPRRLRARGGVTERFTSRLRRTGGVGDRLATSARLC